MPSLHEAQCRHAAHFLEVMRRSLHSNRQPDAAHDEATRLADDVWQQIEHTWGWLAASHSGDDAAARLCSEYPVAGERWYELYLPPRECVRWLQMSLAAARRLALRNHEGRHLYMLGAAHAALGDTPRAAEYDIASLAVGRETGCVRDRAVALLQLAASVSRLGDTVRALKLLARVLDLRAQFDDIRVEALALSRTAENFVKLKNDDIRDLLVKCPELIKRITGEEWREDEDVMYDFVRSYADRVEDGKASYALRLWETAAELSRQTGDQRLTAEFRRNIADAVASKLSADAIVEDPTADTSFQERVWGVEKVRQAKESARKESEFLKEISVPGAIEGKREAQRREFERILNLYEVTLEFYRRENDLRGSANIILRMGHLTSRQGYKGRALDYYEEALSLYGRVGDEIGKATALMGVGGMKAILGDEERAREVWQQAKEIYERSGDLEGRVDAVRRIMGSYMRTNDPRYRANLMEYLRLMDDVKKTKSSSPTLVGAASARARDGDTAGARELLRISVMVDEETGDGEDLAESLCELGWLDFNEGESGRATSLWERALPLARAGEDIWLTKRVFSGLAQSAAKASDVLRALSLVDEVRALRDDLSDYADVLKKVAAIVAESGEYVEALNLFERSAAAYESVGDESRQAAALSDMVELAGEKGDRERIYDIESRMMPLLISLKQWDTLATVLFTMGVLDDAEAPGLLAQSLWLKLRLGVPDESAASHAFLLLDKAGMKSPEAHWIIAAGILLARDAELDESSSEYLSALSVALYVYADAEAKATGAYPTWYENDEHLDTEKVLAGIARCVDSVTGGRWLFDPELVEEEEPT